MTDLAHVAAGQPHVAAHNAERDQINNNTAQIASKASKSGDSMTGPLLLKNGPIIDASKWLADLSDGSAASNRTALNTMFASMADIGTRKVRFTPLLGTGGANIQIAGEITASLDGLEIVGDDCVLQQTVLNKKTLILQNALHVLVSKLRFQGLGAEFQQAGWNPLSSSYNGVAGLYLADLTDVEIERIVCANHAGSSIVWSGSTVGLIDALFRRCIVTGVGIAGGLSATSGGSPVNAGGDVGIGEHNMSGTAASTRVKIIDSDISAHAFGVGISNGDGCEVSGGMIHDIPSQHGIYLSACRNTHVHHMTLKNIVLDAIKNQIAASYPIDVYNFEVDHLIIDTVGLGIVAGTVTAIGEGNHFFGVKIHDNIIRNVVQYAMALGQIHDGAVSRNLINGVSAGYGIYAPGYDGEIYDNKIRNVAWSGIYLNAYDLTRIQRNTFWDVCTAATGAANNSNNIYVSKATGAAVASPQLILEDNLHINPAGMPTNMLNVARVDANIKVTQKTMDNFTTVGTDFSLATVVPAISAPPTMTKFNPPAPTGTSSTGAVMAGFGAWGCVFTPQSTGKVKVTITGEAGTQTAASSATMDGRYGTGTAPANGAGVTGTQLAQGAELIRAAAASATPGADFLFVDIITGLTIGVTYWFDLSFKTANSADAAVLGNMAFIFEECS